MEEFQLREEDRKKTLLVSLSEILFLFYLFFSVNDILLLPLGVLWIKNVLLALLAIILFLSLGFKYLGHILYLAILTGLFFVSFTVAVIYGNNLDYAAQENMALFVTFITPFMMLLFVNRNIKMAIHISIIFLWAIVFATVHKIIYIAFMQGYLSGAVLDLVYEGVAGRGRVDDLERLNTGNQLLVSLALFVAYRFFVIGYRRQFMCFVMIICILNIYLTASLFFTGTTFLLLGIFMLISLQTRLLSKAFFTIATTFFAYFLTSDLFTAREGANMIEDGNIYRALQAEMLFESFLSAPFLGNGPGFAIEDLGAEVPWLFENQVFVLFAKYGIFGFFAFIALLTLQFKMTRFSLSLICYLFSIGFIFLASLFNPYLFGSYAAWAFAISLILAYLFKSDNQGLILSSGISMRSPEIIR